MAQFKPQKKKSAEEACNMRENELAIVVFYPSPCLSYEPEDRGRGRGNGDAAGGGAGAMDTVTHFE